MRLVAGDARQLEAGARVERRAQLVGRQVQVVRVLVVEGGRHVLPVVLERRLDLLLGGDRHERLGGQQVEHALELVDREQLGDVGALLGGVVRGHLRQLAVLGADLGRRRDLDLLGLVQRALREGREVGQPLDLDVEQLAADGALLGGRVDVEDVAAVGELATVLDLVDALVPAGHELVHRLLQVEQPALLDREAVRAQLGVGHLLGQRGGAGDHDRRAVAASARRQRVERRHAQADQVRRRRQVRLVAHAARRVELDGRGARKARRSPARSRAARSSPATTSAGRSGLGVEQRRQQVRAQAGGDERALGRPPPFAAASASALTALSRWA